MSDEQTGKHDDEFIEKVFEQVNSGDSEQIFRLLETLVDNIEQVGRPVLNDIKDTFATFSMIGSIVKGALDEAKAANDTKPTVLSVLKLLKDEDTLRGLNFVLSVVKGIGKRVGK